MPFVFTLFAARVLTVAGLAAFLTAAPSGAANRAPQTAAAPAATTPAALPQVRLALELTRTDTGTGTAAGGNADDAPVARTIATPILSAFSRGSGSVQVQGNDLSYGLSVSPDVERDGRIALLWTLQLSGKTLPGATSANVAGGARVAAGKREPIAEITLRDPKTGHASSFRVYVTATTDAAAAASPPR